MSTTDRASGLRANGGFTLVELLVAMALVGLVSLLLYGGLHFGTRAWERGGVHAAGTEEVRLVRNLLRQSIAGAYPLYVHRDGQDSYIVFDGQPGQIRFLAPIPQSLDAGGHGYLTLRVEQDGRYRRIVLEVRRELASPGQAGRREPLMGHLAGIQFAYFGALGAGNAARWHDSWTRAPNLPQLVRVRVQFPHGDARLWPDLLVSSRIFADQACVYDAVTKDCQGRE